MTVKRIEVYSDGSGNTFESDGAWAFRICIDQVPHSFGSGYLASSTNNVAEITAAINGLKSCRDTLKDLQVQRDDVQITLVSDSQLVLGYASGKYKCKALHLAPLYIELRKLHDELKCQTRWVKGHSGDEHNEFCDKLAKSTRNNKGAL